MALLPWNQLHRKVVAGKRGPAQVCLCCALKELTDLDPAVIPLGPGLTELVIIPMDPVRQGRLAGRKTNKKGGTLRWPVDPSVSSFYCDFCFLKVFLPFSSHVDWPRTRTDRKHASP